MSVAVNFLVSNHEIVAMAVIGLAVLWNAYLLWPEITKLKIVYPKGALVQSPVWLYLFGLCAIGMLIFAFIKLYASVLHQPQILTASEFAQPYIHGK